MRRFAKLILNIFFAAVYVNASISFLILLINPQVHLTTAEFFLLFAKLLLYYGPLVGLLLLFSFGIAQFFSYKRISVGFFSPPSLIYFLAAASLLSVLIHYVNYEYFQEILPTIVHHRIIEMIVADLVIVVLIISLSFIRKGPKLWLQLLMVLIIGSHGAYSYMRSQEVISLWGRQRVESVSFAPIQTEQTRKIRVVMMNGLSHRVILGLLNRTDTLRNFQLLISNGVHGQVKAFKPNTDLLVTSTFLSGLPPSKIVQQDDWCFKVSELDKEFSLFPRFVFFRYSAVLELTAFYPILKPQVVDRLLENYEKHGLGTFNLIYQSRPPIYSSLALNQSNLFIQNFSYALPRKNPSFIFLKRTFFYDEYLKSLLPDLKTSNLHYAAIRLPGLSQISRRFTPYYHPLESGQIPAPSTSSSYAPILESYYHFYDSIIGNLISTTRENEMLVIFGTYELEQMPEWRRVLYSLMGGERDISMYKPLDSRAVIYMFEKNALKKDYPINDVSILDVYPTLLYYAGFRLPKNLQGEVLRGIFTDEFLSEHPIGIDPG